MTPILVHLPDPIGWIALTPDVLHDAQERAKMVLGAPTRVDETTSRAQRAELVDAVGLARALGVDASWVLRSARRREIPVVKLGKYARFCVADVIASRRQDLKP